jgi:hypothetical protein
MTPVLMMYLLAFDIAAVKSEPDLTKRSELALMNADRAMDEARTAYDLGDMKTERAALDEVRDSVDTSYDALTHSRETPRNSKYYKRAELKVRALSRRVAGFRDQVSLDDRPPVESVFQRLQEIHDELLSDIMSKRKKP